jgi:hypothetical protein
MQYSYKIIYTPGKKIITADTFSRQPLADVGDQETTKEAAAQICYVLAHIPATDEKLSEIWKCQQEDITTQKLRKYSQDGWQDLTRNSVSFGQSAMKSQFRKD